MHICLSFIALLLTPFIQTFINNNKGILLIFNLNDCKILLIRLKIYFLTPYFSHYQNIYLKEKINFYKYWMLNMILIDCGNLVANSCRKLYLVQNCYILHVYHIKCYKLWKHSSMCNQITIK